MIAAICVLGLLLAAADLAAAPAGDFGAAKAVQPVAVGQVAQADRPTRAFVLSIDGTGGTRFIAACLVSRGEEAEAVSLEGPVPQQRAFEATGLSCQIRKLSQTGRIVVEVSKDGRVVSRHVSSGSSAVVSVSVQ